jgi:Flp pilus assembly pilin Flp
MVEQLARLFTHTLLPDKRSRQPGQGMTEYGLVLVLVAVVVIVAIGVFGNQTTNLINRTVASLS